MRITSSFLLNFCLNSYKCVSLAVLTLNITNTLDNKIECLLEITNSMSLVCQNVNNYFVTEVKLFHKIQKEKL